MPYNGKSPAPLPPHRRYVIIRVTFWGRIFPELPPAVLPLKHTHTTFWAPSSTGLTGSSTVEIQNCQVVIHCDLNRFERTDFSMVHLGAFRIARAVVDMAAFERGIGLTLIIDKFDGLTGKPDTIHSQDLTLASLCTVSRLDVTRFICMDLQVSRALNELTGTLERPDEILTDCARAIERLTHILAPNAEKKERWRVLRKTLQLSEGYVRLISQTSEGPRHGNPKQPALSKVLDSRRRAWVIMDRFLIFKKRGDKPLDLNPESFPLL
jgi:hypothetical protein